MSLKVHRGVRADQLVIELAELLANPLPDPFATELIITPAKGTERWLSQHISHHLGTSPGARDGVCAGVEFTSPTGLQTRIMGRLEEDPWAPTALVWPLLQIIDTQFSQPWCAPLAQHLGYVNDPEDLRKGRRYAVARRIAGLFASYAAQRPQLLRAWEAGQDSDGVAQLPDDLNWQPHLWR
ncbi:MAG TPA: exodeoxyribonuclease V subunit gamma, partial [Marmoricola sp.]|nr:exodeoxyribonuclease V subunit gamma [Marmoricola sp.]HNO40918.1 exodeoxyribonuclease V subunit gamma [Marmoricola sp.]